MAEYSLSTNIQIFPIANRPKYDPIGKLTTEYNLTSILNRLLDVEGFVIYPLCNRGNDLTLSTTEDKIFEFNINGYLIHIEDITDITSKFDELQKGDKIYACIRIEEVKGLTEAGTATTIYDHQRVDYITGADNQNNTDFEYEGVAFLSSEEFDDVAPNTYTHSLAILEKTDNGWTIPEDSKIKFKTSKSGDHRSVSIDDGVLGEE